MATDNNSSVCFVEIKQWNYEIENCMVIIEVNQPHNLQRTYHKFFWIFMFLCILGRRNELRLYTCWACNGMTNSLNIWLITVLIPHSAQHSDSRIWSIRSSRAEAIHFRSRFKGSCNYLSDITLCSNCGAAWVGSAAFRLTKTHSGNIRNYQRQHNYLLDYNSIWEKGIQIGLNAAVSP